MCVCVCVYVSVQFSCSVVCDSLWPRGLQHARPPCPSPIPRACSNSCPLSWWCLPTISSSVYLSIYLYICIYPYLIGLPGGSVVKNLSAMQETQEAWIQSLGREATHSSILAWRIPWTEDPEGLQSIGSQRVGHDWSDGAHTHSYIYTQKHTHIHIYITECAVHLKLTQHCKPIIFQLSKIRRTSWRKKLSSWATSEVQEFAWSELKFQVTEVLCQWSWYTEEHDVFKVPRESLSLGKVETQSESSEIDKVWNKQDCVKNLWFINK